MKATIWGVEAVRLAEQLGWSYVEQCGGGEFGAHLVRRGNDSAILKVPATADRFHHVAGSVELAGRVRERGQLVPRYFDVGVSGDAVYTLQEHVDGQLHDVLHLGQVQRMIDLLDAHAGAAADWSDRAAGVNVWWDPLDTLRATGGTVAELGEEISEVFERYADVAFPAGDVIHDDYHMRNVLLRDDAIVAIIDWEGAKPGDRRFDAFLLSWWLRAVPRFTTPEASKWLRGHVENLLTSDELAYYAAVNALRNLDFYARVRPAALEEFCIAAVQLVLAPYWRG